LRSSNFDNHSYANLASRPANSVTLKSQDGTILGGTQVTYGTNLQQVVSCPSALKTFWEDYVSGNPSGNPSGNSGGEAESFRTLGGGQIFGTLGKLIFD